MDLLKSISFSISLFLVGSIFIILSLSGGFIVSVGRQQHLQRAGV
jgi:hypothetical protein